MQQAELLLQVRLPRLSPLQLAGRLTQVVGAVGGGCKPLIDAGSGYGKMGRASGAGQQCSSSGSDREGSSGQHPQQCWWLQHLGSSTTGHSRPLELWMLPTMTALPSLPPSPQLAVSSASSATMSSSKSCVERGRRIELGLILAAPPAILSQLQQQNESLRYLYRPPSHQAAPVR